MTRDYEPSDESPRQSMQSSAKSREESDSGSIAWRKLRVRAMLIVLLAEASLLVWYLRQDPLASAQLAQAFHKTNPPRQEDYTVQFRKDPNVGTHLNIGNAQFLRKTNKTTPVVGYLVIPVGDCASCLHADIPSLTSRAAKHGLTLILLTTATKQKAQEFAKKSGWDASIMSDPTNSLLPSLNVVWLGRAYLFSSKWRLMWIQHNSGMTYDFFEELAFKNAREELLAERST